MIQRKKFTSLVVFCLLLAACSGGGSKKIENTSPADTGNAAANTASAPAVISWNVVNEYPHDPHAFTEGLEFKGGILYESAGQYRQSDVRRVDLRTGKVITLQKMGPQYFGEGLTVLDGKVYQLTYREGKGFIYDSATLRQTGSFHFDAPEGWGMTNNGTALIFDDGSNILHYLDPKTFKEVKRLAVTDEHGPVLELNELELIHGFFYANQWRTDYILKIDTATGRVVGRADLGSLRQSVGIPPESGHPNAPDVMNGIAFDAAGNRIFITGKNWPKLLEIKLDN